MKGRTDLGGKTVDIYKRAKDFHLRGNTEPALLIPDIRQLVLEVANIEGQLRVPFPGSEPGLVVLRGRKRDLAYLLKDGRNIIGRADDRSVDIDLEDQESPDRVFCSRQHACITFCAGQITVEDLH